MKEFKFLIFVFIVSFNLYLTACGKETSYFLEEPLETVINEEGDTIKYANKKEIITDFCELSYDNIVVEKSFVIEKKTKNTFQGIAICNNFLFQTHNYGECIEVYNLDDNSFAFTIEREKGEYTLHCNNADFGPLQYDIDDPFPLLYLEHSSGKHMTSVYRIINKDSLYTMVKVQQIIFTGCTNAITNNDNINGVMYVSHTHDGIRSVARIKLPEYTIDKDTIDLNSNNVIDKFDINADKVAQDATIYNNKLFQLRGGSNNGELCIYDLINHKNIFIIDLNEIGIPGEPEGIAWYKDHLVITIRGGQVYNVYFVKTIRYQI